MISSEYDKTQRSKKHTKLKNQKAASANVHQAMIFFYHCRVFEFFFIQLFFNFMNFM